MTTRPPRTYTRQQQVTDARWEAVTARPDDILVENQDDGAVLRPLTPGAKRWLAAHGAVWPMTPARLVDVLANAREDGLRVARTC
jgi:hypothetical protein